jgi:hypothetical protein
MNSIDYKVGIYIRLSREDEEKESYQESESVQNQRTLLMQYLTQNKLKMYLLSHHLYYYLLS